MSKENKRDKARKKEKETEENNDIKRENKGRKAKR